MALLDDLDLVDAKQIMRKVDNKIKITEEKLSDDLVFLGKKMGEMDELAAEAIEKVARNLDKKIDEIDESTTDAIEKVSRKFERKIREKDIETEDSLVKISRMKKGIGPMGPQGEVGPEGPQGELGPQGFDGLQGEMGPSGPIPAHEWQGTHLRFENPDGQMGDWVNLEGPKGASGNGSSGTSTRLRVQDEGVDVSEQVHKINFTNGTITESNSVVTVDLSSGGGGDVNGPASSTDNAIARFNGTGGKDIQNSGVIIDDSDNMTIPGAIDADETLADIGSDTSAFSFETTVTNTGNNLFGNTGISSIVTKTDTNSLSDSDFGLQAGNFLCVNTGAGGITSNARGITFGVSNAGAGSTITEALGASVTHNVAAGTITDFFGLRFESGTEATNVYAFDFEGGFISNSRAVSIADDTAQRYLPVSTVDTGITFPLNNKLTLAVTDQGSGNDNAGVGIEILADDGGSSTTGGAGGDITITAGAAGGSGNNSAGDITLSMGSPTGTGSGGTFSIAGTNIDPTSNKSMIITQHTISPTGNNAGEFTGNKSEVIHDSAFNLTNSSSAGLIGVNGVGKNTGAGTVTRVAGVVGSVSNTGAGTITNAYAFGVSIQESAGTITNAYMIYALNSAGPPTNRFFMRLDSSTPWLSNSRALPVDDAGSTRYLVLSESDDGITFPLNNALAFAVTDQGSGNDNDGVGITFDADNGGSSTTGGDGGSIAFATGSAAGSGNNAGGDFLITLGNPTGSGSVPNFSVTGKSIDNTATDQMILKTYTISPTGNISGAKTAEFLQITHDTAFNLTDSGQGQTVHISRLNSTGTGDIAKATSYVARLDTSAANTITEWNGFQTVTFINASTTVSRVTGMVFGDHQTTLPTDTFVFDFDTDWLSGTGISVRNTTAKTMPIDDMLQVVLPVAATTFAITANGQEMVGDGGGNTLATITGGYKGQTLTLLFTDANITITDDNTHTANTVDLSAAFTSADDTTLTLFFDGTSWYETSRSVN